MPARKKVNVEEAFRSKRSRQEMYHGLMTSGSIGIVIPEEARKLVRDYCARNNVRPAVLARRALAEFLAREMNK